MQKNDLITRLLHHPISFHDENGIDQLIDQGITFQDLRELIRRIYDLNPDQLYRISNANKGIVGFLNRKSTRKRSRTFNHKVDQQKPGKNYIKIYAEGDSWFQFPFFIKDIIDWLDKNDDFLIKCEAYAGDWITNIIYEEQYVSGLSTYSPDFFLISGGGNDLVGNHRLGVMIAVNSNFQERKYHAEDEIKDNFLSEAQRNLIIKSQGYINKEFYALLNVFELQYSLLFRNLYSADSKHKDIISITQGYDFVYPSPKRRFSFRYPWQPLLNKLVDSGNWLFTPFMFSRIRDPKIQQGVMLAMIYEFNNMLASFSQKYPNVFHIDCRGLANSEKDWFDEIHYKSHLFKKVAGAYEYVIREHRNLQGQKTIRAADLY